LVARLDGRKRGSDMTRGPVSAVYARVREDIMTGALAPGSRITIRALCGRFDAGMSPMREALNRMIAERLVILSETRRLRVAPLTEEDLDELTETRCWLEERALRSAIARGDEAWEERVLLLGHRLTRLKREGGDAPIRDPHWEAVHRDFHESLLSSCGSRWLLEFCRQLFDLAERYRLVARLSAAERPRHAEEHQQIAAAIVRRDADEAVRLLSEHYWKTANLVKDWLARGEPAELMTGTGA
jgi:DNA-binding GntR family transcriptional regulator